MAQEEEKQKRTPSIIAQQGSEGRTGPTFSSQAGSALSFEEWVALVRKRNAKYPPSASSHRLSKSEGMPPEIKPFPFSPNACAGDPDSEPNGGSFSSQSHDKAPEISLWDRLGNAAVLDIESNGISWNTLSSLHQTKHTSSTEQSEDELNKPLELEVQATRISDDQE